MKNFSTLGLMVDCSRNAVMKPDGVKEFIDVTANMGFNALLLYTEDTYEVENEPYFGYFRGKYGIEELKALDAYAKTKGVELIPCIQTLAHLNAIFHWSAYNGVKDWDDILMIGNERTYELIDNIFASLRKAFTTTRINIGMDEAYMVGLGRYRQANGERDRFTIMLEHLNRVCEIAKKHGFTSVMLWNDMFNNLRKNSTIPTEEIKKLIPEMAQLVYWDYYRQDENEYLWRIKENKEICENIGFAGGAWTWHGITPLNAFSIGATKAAFSACAKENVRDAYITLWGDDGGECSRFAVLPSLAWSAALGENENATLDDVRELFARATGESYDDFMLLDLPNQIGCDSTIHINNPAKYLVLADPFMGFTDFSVDDTYAPHYAKTAKILGEAKARSKKYGYLFATQEALCDLLSVKADLGKRTRAAYKNGDKAALKELAEKDYPLTVQKLTTYADVFYAQWMKENKPHGFDVQDLRFGGLKERLARCSARLLQYVNGEVESIPELEEEILPFFRGEEGKAGILSGWADNATVNVVSHPHH